MARHRGSNEGSIYKRKSDGRWVAAVCLDGGKRKVVYGATKAEALEKLDAARSAKRAGRLTAAKGQTVAHYLDGWLETIRHSIRVSTYKNYSTGIKWLKPHVGHVRLDRLAPALIQQAYSDMLSSGLSGRSVQISATLLRTALKQAVRLGLMTYDPTDMVTPPRRTRHELSVLTAEQAYKLFECTKDDPLHALWVTLASTGLRIGEALGLKWDDVSLEDRTLTVRRGIQRQPGKGLVFVEPKTAAGRRTVNLTVTAAEALRGHRTRQLGHRLEIGPLWQDQRMVFASDFGTPLDGSNAYHRFQSALSKATLPHMRLHDLRHTAATLMLTEGIHPKVVQEMLGHSNITLTLATYSHVLPTMQREAADKLDTAFNRVRMAQ
ncbi:MAG TPA: tyrosine-type recombinase/integrase [Chloroflexota bacterium]|nr:tyrosine-type recombinase/integrase [Chloroflexota bacterium]